MSANDYLIDAELRHQIMIQRLAGGAYKRLLPILEKLQQDLRARLMSDPTEFQLYRSVTLLADINALIRAANGEISDGLMMEVNDFAQYETEFQHKLISKVANVEIALPATQQVISSVTMARATLVSGKTTQQMTIKQMIATLDGKSQRIESIIRAGAISGAPIDQMVRDAMKVAGDVNKRDLRTIVRTAINMTGSVARRQLYAENSDIISGEKWVSTLDGRTSDVCIARDGKEYELGRPPFPPAHMNCRSLRVPIIKPEFAVPGLRGMRSSRNEDGTVEQVSSRTTYNSWLKTQSHEFQNEVLGIERAKLFRGGMNVDKFVDDDGRTLTLRELKQREGITL